MVQVSTLGPVGEATTVRPGTSPPVAPAQAPAGADWKALPGLVRHTFTHFHLELTVLAGRAAGSDNVDGVWCPVDRLGDHALPTVMRKVCAHALAGGGKG